MELVAVWDTKESDASPHPSVPERLTTGAVAHNPWHGLSRVGETSGTTIWRWRHALLRLSRLALRDHVLMVREGQVNRWLLLCEDVVRASDTDSFQALPVKNSPPPFGKKGIRLIAYSPNINYYVRQ
eukprot:5186131-Amphidinium_carterae.1